MYEVSTLTLGDLARRMGWSRRQTQKRLSRNWAAPYCQPDSKDRYDVRVVDLLRGLYENDYEAERARAWLQDLLSGRHTP